MERESRRTLLTLSTAYQRRFNPSDYEVIVVDAGSDLPLSRDFVCSHGPNFRLIRTEASPSPAAAVNQAALSARGEAIALCIDGARMLSPGIIRLMLDAFEKNEDPVVATLSWHLGPKVQNVSMLEGYNQSVEDALLDSVDWRTDGYELFRISSLAGSSKQGWFGRIAESNCLAVSRHAWRKLGGVHEEFRSPGGGLVNLDFYRRACEQLGELVILLGEGTFHQYHGGVASNVPCSAHPWTVFLKEYQAIRGKEFAVPEKMPTYLGSVPPQARNFIL
jgi:hypothetical protein